MLFLVFMVLYQAWKSWSSTSVRPPKHGRRAKQKPSARGQQSEKSSGRRSSRKKSPSSKLAAWTCPTCTYLNPPGAQACEMCHDAVSLDAARSAQVPTNHSRPTAATASSGSRLHVAEAERSNTRANRAGSSGHNLAAHSNNPIREEERLRKMSQARGPSTISRQKSAADVYSRPIPGRGGQARSTGAGGYVLPPPPTNTGKPADRYRSSGSRGGGNVTGLRGRF